MRIPDSDSISPRRVPTQEEVAFQEVIIREALPFLSQFIYESEDLEAIKEAVRFFDETWVDCEAYDVPIAPVGYINFLRLLSFWKEAHK